MPVIRTRFSPIRHLTRGFGGPAASIVVSAFLSLSLSEVLEEVSEIIGKSSKTLLPEYSDIVPDIVKIRVILEEVNRNPLGNPLIRSITSLVVRNELVIKMRLTATKSFNSSSPKIVIGEKRISYE